MNKKSDWEGPGHGWMINGPNGTVVVHEHRSIEPVIKGLQLGTNYDDDDYTATRIIDLDYRIDPASIRRR